MQTNTKNRIHAHELLSNRLTRVNLAVEPLITKINRDFLRLIDNPPPGPTAWSFNTTSKIPGKVDCDTGLWESNGNQNPTDPNRHKDHKITFHYRRDLWRKLEEFNPDFLKNHQELLKNCQALLRCCQFCLMGIVMELDELLGTKITPLIGSDGDDEFDVIRLIAYTQLRDDAKKNEIGEPHNDRSAWTFALHESGPGLQAAQSKNVWQAISSEPNKPLLFNDCKAAAATNGRLKPLYHGIVQIPQPRVHPRVLRTSIIAFLHLQGFELPPDYDTHSYVE